MEEQFGGRTDDALFFDDDFEPVAEESKPIYEGTPEPAAQPPAQPPPAQPPAPAAPAPAPAKQNHHQQQKQQSAPSELAPPKNLSQSRHATRSPRPSKPKARAPSPKDTPAPAPAAPTAPAAAAAAAAAAAPAQQQQGAAGGGNPETRIASGANPRTKLTDDELAAKMERMRILAAEKARKFEVAERDERQHAAAYRRDMEEARKRRAADAERRKRGEEERKRMEDERARNRERKLKAIGREGNWDEGKEEVAEREAVRAFRGANGGVRGARTGGGGLAGSRFADEAPRGGGRGGRGRGRGGRGGGAESEPRKQAAPNLTGDQFPALPASEAPAKTSEKPEKPALDGAYIAALTKGVKEGGADKGAISPADSLPGSPPVGRWDDEMEAFDEKMKKG